MPAPRARQITLTAAERRRLKRLAHSHTAPYQQVIRVRIVLDAAHGYSNAKISRRLGVTVDTAGTWRGRYADQRMAGLADRRRSGRPARFTPLQTAEVKALACQLPAETGIPLSRWSCPDLAAEAVTRGITATISASTVRRILATDTIKPWQYRSWLFIRDPDFAVKAKSMVSSSPRHRQRPAEFRERAQNPPIFRKLIDQVVKLVTHHLDWLCPLRARQGGDRAIVKTCGWEPHRPSVDRRLCRRCCRTRL